MSPSSNAIAHRRGERSPARTTGHGGTASSEATSRGNERHHNRSTAPACAGRWPGHDDAALAVSNNPSETSATTATLDEATRVATFYETYGSPGNWTISAAHHLETSARSTDSTRQNGRIASTSISSAEAAQTLYPCTSACRNAWLWAIARVSFSTNEYCSRSDEGQTDALGGLTRSRSVQSCTSTSSYSATSGRATYTGGFAISSTGDYASYERATKRTYCYACSLSTISYNRSRDCQTFNDHHDRSPGR